MKTIPLTYKTYLNLSTAALLRISKNDISVMLLCNFLSKEQSNTIMKATGSAGIIHEKLLCAMSKGFRREATSGILNSKGKFSVAVCGSNIYYATLRGVLSSIPHSIHDSPDYMVIHNTDNILSIAFFLPFNLKLINFRKPHGLLFNIS